MEYAIVIVAVCLAIALHMYLYKNYHYICKECSTSFKPDTFLQSMFGFNFFKQRKLKCPNCKIRVWANVVKGDVPGK